MAPQSSLSSCEVLGDVSLTGRPLAWTPSEITWRQSEWISPERYTLQSFSDDEDEERPRFTSATVERSAEFIGNWLWLLYCWRLARGGLGLGTLDWELGVRKNMSKQEQRAREINVRSVKCGFSRLPRRKSVLINQQR
jgi:hypothetical protein